MTRAYCRMGFAPAVIVLAAAVTMVLSGSVLAGISRGGPAESPEPLDPCEQLNLSLRGIVPDVRIEGSALTDGPCDSSKSVGHFTLYFDFVEYYIPQDVSRWRYRLVWDRVPPPVDRFALMICQAEFLGACPGASGVEVDPDGLTWVVWDDLPSGQSITLTLQIRGIFGMEIGQTDFALRAGTENYLETTCGIPCGGPAECTVSITCPSDVTVECDMPTDPSHTGEPTVVSDCPEPIVITFEDVITGGACPYEYEIERTWRATAPGGETDSCVQYIYVVDTTPPLLVCPPDLVVECDYTGDYGEATATDNCDPDPVITIVSGIVPGECPQEFVITRTWTATDACGNSSSCSQTIEILDTTPPEMTCAPDDVIPCEAPVVFTDPEVTDNCDPDPTVTIISTATVPGPDPYEYTHTRCWEAMDACGNADTCCQNIYEEPCEEGEPCTYTQGGWGSKCPCPQRDDMMSTQPGCIRDHYFDSVFPSGVTIGGPDTHTAMWTTAAAVRDYLPAGSTPGVLTGNLVNPTTTPAGVLGGQILALRMNREYSCADIFYTLGLTPEPFCMGDFVIPAVCGKFAGLTVDEFLLIADQAVGGNTSVLDPYSASLSDLDSTATCLNEFNNDCGEEADGFAAVIFNDRGEAVDGSGTVLFDYSCYPDAEWDVDVSPTEGLTGSSREADRDMEPVAVEIPTELRVSTHPNPMQGSTTIRYSLPFDARVIVDIYNIRGRKMACLLDASKSAGFHGVVWNGRDDQGNAVNPGVYFCRVQVEGHPAILEKIIKM